MAPTKADLAKIQASVQALAEIETTLNAKINKPAFRKELFENPIEVLSREGLAIPPAKRKAVRDFFKSAIVPPDAYLRVAPDLGQAAAWGIGIGIRVTF